MATHSSFLGWEIPWIEEPGRLQSLGSQSWKRLKRLSMNMHSCASLNWAYRRETPVLQAEKLEQKGGTLGGWGKGDGAGLRMDGSCQKD